MQLVHVDVAGHAPFGEIRIREFIGAKAGIQVLRGQWACGLDFLARQFDAFAGNVGNGLESCLAGFGIFGRGFGQLHHNETAIAAVFGVELHDSMSGCGATCEEIKNSVIY